MEIRFNDGLDEEMQKRVIDAIRRHVDERSKVLFRRNCPVSAPSEAVNSMLKALGLDGHRVTSLALHIDMDAAVSVTVRRLIDGDELLALAEVCQQFNLVPKEQ